MIKPQAISGFGENLPEAQLIEEKFKDIIKKNYSLSGFTPIDTPVVERLDVLLAKGADDNEVYAIHRVNGEVGDDSSLGLRFDLTVPLARYVAQYEGELTFPFRRQHIGRVYRGERPQKGRYREFYQADVDIIGNGDLPLFADVEVISTVYNSLRELDFGEFVININNKKFLGGFLKSLSIENIAGTISIIDKKDKVRHDKLNEMFISIGLNNTQIEKIVEFIRFGEEKTSVEILTFYSQFDDELLKTGIEELKFLYNNLISLGVEEKYLKINPSISRGLNYYTGTVFETFIVGAENMGSVSSGGRYENLASNFTKNNYPGVGGSIGLSRLIAVLNNIGKIELNRKTVSKVMLVNMGDETLKTNLEILSILRKSGISCEIYLESEAKIVKQLKYANNKKINFVIIIGEEELKNNTLQLKNLDSGVQSTITKDELNDYIK
ncbi:MAG: histidine--tRNA ligase [Candidatus Gracilibacteria bacterium]|nr:histidine--tRNA ligase [Candidatus Gracilibacteria bacterium]